MSYKDKEWLEKEYHKDGVTQGDIAEQCGVSRATISRWVSKHGIESKGVGTAQAQGEYKDAEWLREKYISECRSMPDIASEFGVSKETIKYWLKKHGIEIRSQSDAAKIRAEKHESNLEGNRRKSIHPNIFTHKDKGYVRVQCGVSKKQASMHRLLATLLVDDIGELDGKHVHHKHELPWLNYLDGIEVLTPKQHKQKHVE